MPKKLVVRKHSVTHNTHKKKSIRKVSGVVLFVIAAFLVLLFSIILPLAALYIENHKAPVSYLDTHAVAVLGTTTDPSTELSKLKKPSWWSAIPPGLQSFLELLYVYAFVYKQNSNLAHLLEGVFEQPTTTNAPTPTQPPMNQPVSLIFNNPMDGGVVAPGTLTVSYAYTGDKTTNQIDHIHLKLDDQGDVRDTDFDGNYAFSNVTAGQHTLYGYLAKVDHSIIPGGEKTITFTVSSTQPTSTPRPTSMVMPTSAVYPTAPPNGNAPSGGLGVGRGDGLNMGINLATFNQLKSEAASGAYSRPCTAAEHDSTKWHTIVNPVAKCHYDHQHGDDPNYVNDVCAQRADGSQVCFGEPGDWFGKPGQSISYPWQTFKLPAGVTNDHITAEQAGATNGLMENQFKHEPYTWIVRRDQPCLANTVCTTDFRVQFHGAMFTPEALTRYHSISIESRICRNANDPKTCGIYRTGGWADYGILLTPQYDNSYDCGGIGSSRFGDPEIETYLDLENLFDPIYPKGHPDRHRNYPPGVDERFRCHQTLTSAQVQSHLNSGKSRIIDQWWIRDPNRAQIRFFDPIGNTVENPVGSQKFAVHFYCEHDPATGLAKDPKCRMNNAKFTMAMEYVTAIPEFIGYASQNGSVDSNGDGRTDVTAAKKVYMDRWKGSVSKTCAGPSLDCVPYIADNIELNAGGKEGGYDHNECTEFNGRCPVLDHDLTPTNQSSWISWFYKHAGM